MPTLLPGTPPHILALKLSPIISNISGQQPHYQQHKEILCHLLIFSLSSSSLLAHVLYLVIFLHSSISFISPSYTPCHWCLCGIEVLLYFVVATNIHNVGQLYYLCDKCAWFHWGDGAFNPTPAATMTEGPQVEGQCCYLKCAVIRVGRKCQCRMCHKHCHTVGDCTSNDHFSKLVQAVPQPQSSFLHGPPLLAPLTLETNPLLHPFHPFNIPFLSMSQIDPFLCPSHEPDPLPQSVESCTYHLLLPGITSQHSNLLSTSFKSSLASSPSSGIAVSIVIADPSINAYYILQLQLVFIEHHVIVFSFANNDIDSIVVDFQDGFTYPYFKLMQVVLNDLELASPDNDQLYCAVHYFNPAFDTWVKVKVDSVIKLTKPLQKLFFKGTNVMSYPSFDHHLQAAATPSHHMNNPCVSLLQEHNYVKHNLTIMKACTLDTDKQLESMLDKDQSDALSLLSQKHHVGSNQPLLPF
ncbi:hypothetical protein HD554DRAFT_2120035 [Boletus coccyginus]|nr:hypothetical protein HD554DRAFT_2120035 [Boletus coccyginus]